MHKEGVRIIGILSITILICVVIGQSIWLNKVRKIKTNEFHELTTIVLSETLNEFLGREYIDTTYHFSCGLALDGQTFLWGEKAVKITSFQEGDAMIKAVFYDHLYQNNFLSLEKIDSLYKERLQEKGIYENPVLLVRDPLTGQMLMASDSLFSFERTITTHPVAVGYECKHQLLAIFREPSFFRSMIWHLLWEGLFLIGFVLCLVWQWRTMRMTWRSAKIQTMGMAHLEHELKKPLESMLLAVGDLVNRKNNVLTESQELKLRLIKARLLKIADVTDTMLVALKNPALKLDRRPVDVRQEMELVGEMFRALRSYARVNFEVEDGIGKPWLDRVYFHYLVTNLVDNAIKYGGKEPVVHVRFGRDGAFWVLTVADNGIGMPTRVLKRIFKQFYRVKDKRVMENTGFGLGLSFVRKVVAAYDGKIEVESEPGRGSRFIIRLRAMESEQEGFLESGSPE